MSGLDLHLASSSERRRDILRALAVQFTWSGEDLDESPKIDEPVTDLVLRLARAKANAARASRPDRPVILGADTVVTLDGRAMGKPQDRDDALRMLADFSDRRHQVLTAVAVNSDGKTIAELSTTEVCFRAIAADEAAAYWQSGEPQGKAGAYAIQGRAGIFVRSISGSYSGVVGLPVYETANLLKRAGIDVAVSRDEQNTE